MKPLNYSYFLKIIVFVFCLFLKTNQLCSQGWGFIPSYITNTPNIRVDKIISDFRGNLLAYPLSGSLIYKWDGNIWQILNPLNSNLKLKYCSINAVYNDTISNKLYLGGFILDSLSRNVLIYYDGIHWQIVTNSHQVLSFASITSIARDNSGNIYMARNSSSTRFYVAKFDGSSWSEVGGYNSLGANASIYSMAIDKNNNVYVSGDFTNSNGETYVANFNGSTWIDLGILNTIPNATPKVRTIANLTLNSNNQLFACSYMNYPTNCSLVFAYDGSKWKEVVKISNVVFSTMFETLMSLNTDLIGNIYITGYELFSSNNEFMVWKWDGTNLYEMRGNNINGCKSKIDNPVSITSDGRNNLYAVTDFYDTNCYPLVAKYMGTNLVSIKKNIANIGTKIYPNPCSVNFIISGHFALGACFTLYGINGNIVTSQKTNESNAIEVDMTNIDNGIYFAEIRDEKGSVERFKIIKQN